ncbi:uncharacterized protein [Epargyreus clarus]|uniref:uncharacterized protein isoform X1 n=1 Tax=Epargyreus clarus TaxID=520877 RepID=UPI003C2AC3BB
MSGKAYTMREMKMIVEYLIEHRAFAEYRGRKMWMDFAGTNVTTRTWQSLKETFLKRILPDITNPYYKLTVQQIASFQQGCDIEAKINNKLEIRTVDENSNSSDSHNKDPQPPKPGNSKEVDDAGEPNHTKVNQNRSSTDTAMSEPCYKTAEDIRKDLESPNKPKGVENVDDSPAKSSMKSIRDYITYSEPLTPMLQEVIDDFGTDDEGDEPQMQIVEFPETNNRNDNLSPIEILDTENNECDDEKMDNVQNNTNKETASQIDSVMGNKSNQDVLQDNIETECIDITDDTPSTNASENQVENITSKEDVIPNTNESNVEKNNPEHSENQESQIQSNSTAVVLPNNQEAFQQLHNNADNYLNKPGSSQSVEKISSNSRKRSHSQDIHKESPKKSRSDKNEAQTLSDDSQTQKEHNVATTSKLSPYKGNTKLSTVKSNITFENDKKNNNSVNTQNGNETHKNKNDENLRSNPDNLISSDDVVSKKPKSKKKVIALKDIEEDSVTSEETSRKKDKDTSSKGDTTRESSIQHESGADYMKEVINDVVILKSQSESSSDDIVLPPKKNKALRASHKMYRDKALANVFGFSAGVGSKRQKHVKQQKRHSSHRRIIIDSSGSSEWTSDTGSEYVSPPRGRKNKQTRKYLKPKPARILSLEEEGGLFVMYGKKIYPVVKDGKIIKNYLTYNPENDSEDEDSYWKLKYVEERKKTDELTKLLKHNEKREIVPVESHDIAVAEPIMSVRSSTSTDPSKESIEKNVESSNKDAEKTKKETTESKTVKIKFTKNNEEVQLEGHWSHIHPVLQQVVEILHKEPANEKPAPDNPMIKERGSNVLQQQTDSPNKLAIQKQKTGRDSTSTDVDYGDVREKVNKLEEEIFKEIEERDKSDSMLEDLANTNVTKRRSLKQTKASSAPVSPTKKRKLSSEDQKITEALPKRRTLHSENNTTIVTRQQSRTPKKMLNDKEENEKVTNSTRKTTRRSTKNVVAQEDDSQVKYKFPSPQNPQPTATRKMNKSNPKVNTNKRSKRRYADTDSKILSSPENLSCNSIDSTQGYQDSDASTLSMCLRKKRKSSLTNLNRGKSKSQRILKRKLRSYISEDLSSDSSRSFVSAPLKSSSRQDSSLNTEIYRSESYQMLFPQKKHSIQHLEMIAETSPTINSNDCLNNNDYGISNLVEHNSNHINNLSPALDNDGENSSNVTLPPSPVLSIVENISINRNALSHSHELPTDTTAEEVKQTMLNDYMFADVDMSVPLMEQECGLEKSCDNPTECHYNMNVTNSTQQISESFLNKICAVNIKEPTLSESINQKLRNLLLESAKKIANRITGNNNNTESKMEICEPNKQLKANAKKRCSTPRKRQKKQDVKVANTELLVEKEHTESFGSRLSNPPPVLVVTNAADDNVNTIDGKGNSDKTKTRKKKDVIKVKIVKPTKKKKVQCAEDTRQKTGKTSLQTDSGINDTESGVFLHPGEDSIDLIHNHSDTCLHAHECVGDSVEIIENNVSSIISLNSNSAPLHELKSSKSMINLNEEVLLDIFCENAQDGDNLSTVTSQRISGTILNSSDANISPINSLLTDDLSDESSIQTQKRSSKWYLLSEDESNTNYVDVALQKQSSSETCGANLHQIFPITCAVPDLSTITEENTAKFIVDRNIKSDIDSQSFPG